MLTTLAPSPQPEMDLSLPVDATELLDAVGRFLTARLPALLAGPGRAGALLVFTRQPLASIINLLESPQFTTRSTATVGLCRAFHEGGTRYLADVLRHAERWCLTGTPYPEHVTVHEVVRIMQKAILNQEE